MTMPYDDYDPDDRDAPQPMDLDGQGGDEGEDDELIACSNCGWMLHEDAAVCPKCGEWIIDESLAQRRSRGWIWPLGIVFLVIVILVMWHGLR
jgi:predicted RNA-binding Zn-ribbon protein involved in translation (DUF1610 family)